jgi:hypothetical protein
VGYGQTPKTIQRFGQHDFIHTQLIRLFILQLLVRSQLRSCRRTWELSVNP